MNADKLGMVRELTIDAMDKSFVLGMNYQRLTTLERVVELASKGGFTEEQVGIIANSLGLLMEATDADIPTSSHN